MPYRRPMRYVPGIAPSPYAAAWQLAVARRIGLDVVTGSCRRCGAEHVRHGRQAYCSTECLTHARRERQRLPQTAHVCETCGVTFRRGSMPAPAPALPGRGFRLGPPSRALDSSRAIR